MISSGHRTLPASAWHIYRSLLGPRAFGFETHSLSAPSRNQHPSLSVSARASQRQTPRRHLQALPHFNSYEAGTIRPV